MKYLNILFILIILISCNSSDYNKKDKVDTKVVFEQKKPGDAIKNKAEDWSNPVLIKTGSFGNYINAYYKIGNYDDLYKLTDSKSKNRWSKEIIIEKYKNMPLGFDLKFPINKTQENDLIWLQYRVEINATKKILRMPVVVEKDTSRLVLDLFEKELLKISS